MDRDEKILSLLRDNKINCLSVLMLGAENKQFPYSCKFNVTIDYKPDGKRNKMTIISVYDNKNNGYLSGDKAFRFALNFIVSTGEWENFDDYMREEGYKTIAMMEQKSTIKNIASQKAYYKYCRGLYTKLEKLLGTDLLQQFLEIEKGG